MQKIGRILFMILMILEQTSLPVKVTPRCLEKRLHIRLPSSAVVENYRYTLQFFVVQLSVDENDIEPTKEILIDYCERKQYASREHTISYLLGPTEDWWIKETWWNNEWKDMDKNAVDFFYHQPTKGKFGRHTKWKCIFMAKDNAGKTHFYFQL